ncbi:MAG TPA: inositol monophosphatase family protein, partial [Acetobacteraceae bacterium]|nr:inositol monophosphatase family protein [Acetobacteraceae bacterium]
MILSARDAANLSEVLRAAGQIEVLPRFRRLVADEVRAKSGPLDVVTAADEAAERYISAALAACFPGCVVVGEEATAADPSLLGLLAEADLAFVVDPIDGTFNYAAGVPLFAVMAAALVRGEVVLAAIHDPMGDDVALALRGEGAWSESPDGRRADLRVAAPGPLAAMTGIVSWQFLPEPRRSQVCAALPRLAASWNYRCAGHEYRMAAAGHCHALLYHRLLPWDHAPGWLLHREAGGYSARFDGSPYTALEVTGGLLCAPDEESWQVLHRA